MSAFDVVLLYWVVLVIALLGVAATLWFFRLRRKMIAFIRDVTITLEKHYNPSSKEYRLLGYLVGYKARYILPGKHRVYILLTTTPRHSLLYYPVIILAGRRDRLEVGFNPHDRVVVGEVYLVKKNSRIDNAVLRQSVGSRLDELASRELRGVYEYIVYYKDEKLYDKIAEAVSRIDLPVTMIATYPRENLISVVYEVSLDTLEEFLEFTDRIVRELSLPKRTK